jgi:hypothetical protein
MGGRDGLEQVVALDRNRARWQRRRLAVAPYLWHPASPSTGDQDASTESQCQKDTRDFATASRERLEPAPDRHLLRDQGGRLPLHGQEARPRPCHLRGREGHPAPAARGAPGSPGPARTGDRPLPRALPPASWSSRTPTPCGRSSRTTKRSRGRSAAHRSRDISKRSLSELTIKQCRRGSPEGSRPGRPGACRRFGGFWPCDIEALFMHLWLCAAGVSEPGAGGVAAHGFFTLPS